MDNPIVINKKILTQPEMASMFPSFNYHLQHGMLMKIPIDQIDGLDPEPADWSDDEGTYHDFSAGKEVTKPIEVWYEEHQDKFMLYDGNHRIKQAKVNNDKYILALVQAKSRNIYNRFISMSENKLMNIRKIINEEIDKMSAIDLQGYYEKHVNNKEWLQILSKFPEELQREIIDERPDGSKGDIEHIKHWRLKSNKPIQRLIKEEVRNFISEEYSDNQLYGYHVTYKDNVDNIFKSGLKVGGAEMQGKGLYSFYYLDYEGHAGDAKYYATKTTKDTAIIKFSVNPRRILILNSKIAKEVLGDEYLITDQIKNLDYHRNIIEQSAKMNNMSVEDFEKKINTRFLNDEKNWWNVELYGDWVELGSGRLFEGEYGMTYVITHPSNLDIVGYYDVTYEGFKQTFDPELKTIKDNTILDIINKDDTYNNLKSNININQLESISDINKLIYQFDEAQIKVRNNIEYDLYGAIIDDLKKLKRELQNQSTDTTDYSKIRGIA